MLMIMGVLVFVLGFLGCFGSFRENRVCLIIVSFFSSYFQMYVILLLAV